MINMVSPCPVPKNKATTDINRLSPFVGNADEISNFIKDFEKVVNFIKAQHYKP